VPAITILLRKQPELIRYLIAGGTAFAADFAVFYLCSRYLGLHYLVGNLFGYGAGLLTSYFLNIRWVFTNRKFETGIEFTLFNIIVLAGLGLSELLMYLFVEQGGLHYLYAKIGASGLVFVYNYTAKKLILFPSRVPTASRSE
jgi:putative flippase GtrA